MSPERPKSPEEIQEEYVALWQGIFDEVAAKLDVTVEFGISVEQEAMTSEILKIEMKNSKGALIGYVEFKPLKKDAIYIEHSLTSDDILKEGVYTALIARILLEYPQTKTILGYFAETNLKLYVDAKQVGNSQEDAVKETPAYKSRVKLGFSQIESKDKKLICHRDDQVI